MQFLYRFLSNFTGRCQCYKLGALIPGIRKMARSHKIDQSVKDQLNYIANCLEANRIL